MGQVSLARIGRDHVREGGSITLTTGVSQCSGCRGALRSRSSTLAEGFVRAAALEMPRMLRINAVSPPWVKKTGEIGHGPDTGLHRGRCGESVCRGCRGQPAGEDLRTATSERIRALNSPSARSQSAMLVCSTRLPDRPFKLVQTPLSRQASAGGKPCQHDAQ